MVANRPKLAGRPPIKTPEDFIAGAGQPAQVVQVHTEPTSRPKAVESHPWDAPGVRDDVAKVFNLRLPEPYLLKLRWLAERSPKSMQTICMDALQPAIDRAIREALKREP